MALASFLAHRFDQALVDSARAITLGESTDTPTVLAGGHLATALVLEITGRLDEARPEFDKVIAISRPAGDVANEAAACLGRLVWEGKHDEAAPLYDRGIRLARGHGVLMPALEGMFMAGVNFTAKGDYDAAVAILEDGLALAEKVGDENYTPRTLNSLGWLYLECGALDRAHELNRVAADQAHRRGDHEMIANAELTGDIGSARHLPAARFSGIPHGRDPTTSAWMRWRYSLHLFSSLADHALSRGAWGEAQAHAERCLTGAVRTRSMKYVAKGRRLLAEIALGRREWAEADASLREALTLAETIRNPTQIWKTHVARPSAQRGEMTPRRPTRGSP